MHHREHAKDPILAVDVRDLRLEFNGRSILQGINLQVPTGKVVAFIGPNGAGKTTLLRCLLGLQKFSSGEIRLFGEASLTRSLRRVGYVPQKINLERTFILSVREFLCLGLPQMAAWFWRSHRAN